jgi:hypothetical protein
MDTTRIWAGVSPFEVVVLAVLVLLCLAAGWAMFQKWSGRAASDVSGLRLGQHRGAPRSQ